MDTPYISSEEFPSWGINTEQIDFSIFYLNIRSIKKTLGISNFFYLVRISPLVWYVFRKHGWMRTHCLPRDLYLNCLIIKIDQVRNYSKGGGVSIYINKSLEILFYKEGNTLGNVLYRPQKGVIEPL